MSIFSLYITKENMNTLPGKFISFSSHYTTSCCDLKYSPSLVTVCCKWRNFMTSTHLPRLVSRGNREFICRVNDTETEPDSNNDKEGGVHEDGEVPHSTDLDGPVVDKNKDETKVTQTLKALNSLRVDENKAPVELEDRKEILKAETKVTQTLKALNSLRVDENKAPVELGDREEVKVQSGSPLPGVEPQELDETIRIPKEIIEVLRNEVFGFDSFFVTSQEPYEGGVLFKGNLRGQAAQSYEKLAKRLQDKLGDKYKLFLLTNPEDDSPVAVVVPKNTLQPETTAVPEWFAAGAFGLVTVFTLLLRNVPALQSDVLSTFDNIELLKDGLPGAIVTALILGAHEIGHILVAKDAGVKLGIPYFIPSWQIGSFGAITRISNIVPKREDLLKVAAAGPIAGFSLGFVLLLLGFVLPPSDGLGVVVNASVFHESLLAGGIAKVILGDALKEGTAISVNPLVIWASAGLLINALSSIPAGEIDGGRISFAIWGRKVSSRVTAASIALLGFSSLFSDVAFYWVVLIFFLQRRTIAPLSEEITDPDNKYIALGISVLLLGLLVCLPYPFPFTPAEAVVDIL